MWIFTNKGFISAVQHREKPDLLIVRARKREDLLDLFPEITEQGGIQETPDADYRWRVEMTPVYLSRAIQKEIQGIDYDNFKDSIPAKRIELREFCSHVWRLACNYQGGWFGSLKAKGFRGDGKRDQV